MIGKDENNVIHRSDAECNPKVAEAINLAKLTRNPRDYIDCMYGGKDTNYIRQNRDTNRINKRRENLVIREDEER